MEKKGVMERKKQNGMVSICGFCYGNSEFIIEAIQSTLRCEYTLLEIIITDDGSEDPIHRDRLRKFAESLNWPVTLLLHESNAGLVARYNEALMISSGEFIFGIGDDIHEEGAIDVYVDCLVRNQQADAVFAIAQWYDEPCKSPQAKFFGHLGEGGAYPKLKTGEWLFNQLMKRNWLSAPASMWRCSSLLKDGGYDTQFSFEDWPMLLKVAKRPGTQFIFLADILLRYRRMDAETARLSEAKKKWAETLWLEVFLCRLYYGDRRHWVHRSGLFREMMGSWEKGKDKRKKMIRHPLVKSWFPLSRFALLRENRTLLFVGLCVARLERELLKG